MSEAKFTKGPWKTGPKFGVPDTVIDKKRTIIADVIRRNTTEELVANTNLIAAAPDLYEALERSIGMLEDYALDYKSMSGSSEVHPIHKEIIDQAKQALAKARGEL